MRSIFALYNGFPQIQIGWNHFSFVHTVSMLDIVNQILISLDLLK